MTNTQLVVKEKNITDVVLNRINKMQTEGSLQIPDNYVPENALKSAYLKLLETKTKDGKPVLKECTQESTANALLEMVVQGLNPMKNQGYFIPFGNKLTFVRSYLGTIAITKRIPGVKDVKGYAVYKDDEFETEFDVITGKLMIKKYTPNIKNRNPKDLIGAFALIIGEEGILHMEYMDMEQIKKSWNMGAMKGNSSAHKEFPDQMAIKTVINRACKMYANTSDDTGLFANLLNRAKDEVEADIEANANKEVLDFEENQIEAEYEVVDEPEVDPETGEVIEDPKQMKLEPEF
ncbi:MAG: recombinase RecT [Tissierellales bacterium]